MQEPVTAEPSSSAPSSSSKCNPQAKTSSPAEHGPVAAKPKKNRQPRQPKRKARAANPAKKVNAEPTRRSRRQAQELEQSHILYGRDSSSMSCVGRSMLSTCRINLTITRRRPRSLRLDVLLSPLATCCQVATVFACCQASVKKRSGSRSAGSSVTESEIRRAREEVDKDIEEIKEAALSC